uniref:Putative nucleolar protein 10 n=1 Tax=Ornithodoros turicata TaxID=34597 RepID=A0A2R5LEN2_9ACAR
MQVSDTNNVKIYNLSVGRSLPEWLSDRKKRMLAKKHSDIRHRIELIQDFDMPTVSNCVKMSKDGQYILATGIYKPRVRCFEVSQLSMKFERCFDSEAVTFEVLSDDYSKIVFLQCDRYVEFHANYGRYHRLRIPKFGRDMAYLPATCEMYFAADGPEVYRLNLDLGQFYAPLVTEASSVNVCRVNPYHNLIVFGTEEGKVEAFDPRCRTRVGVLECALNSVTEDTEVVGMPSVTALEFRDALMLGVGMGTGQSLLFDIRSDKPLLVKDHFYGLPIKRLRFHPEADIVLSMDSKVVKLWDRVSGKAFTSITAPADLNDLCLVGNSGLMFLANEDTKMLSYFIPSLGPAPKWCSFLDNLTEELEETHHDTTYDDYKFLTRQELEGLGLGHLIGTNLLRAYMHGYFIDIRLYHKAKALVQPFSYDEYKKKKIKETIEAARVNRVKSASKLPAVNRSLAQKLQEAEEFEPDNAKQKKKAKSATGLLHDTRFKAMFENKDFEIDPSSEEFRLLKPVVSNFEKQKIRRQQKEAVEPIGVMDLFTPVEEEKPADSTEESSSDDDRSTADVMRQARDSKSGGAKQPRMYELKSGIQFDGSLQKSGKVVQKEKHARKLTLEQRLQSEAGSELACSGAGGNRAMTFDLRKTPNQQRWEEEKRKHLEERRKSRRSTKGLKMKAFK